MNTARYLNYRQAVGVIEALDHDALGDDGVEVLRELAQDMLLTRGYEFDHDLVEHGAATISTMISTGDLAPAVADRLWKYLCASGPRAQDAAELAPAAV